VASVAIDPAVDFDLWALVSGKQDLIVAAAPADTPMSAVQGYVAFIGGYANTRSRMRLLGQEAGDTARVVTPARRHRLQLSRRDGRVWTLLDGRPVLWAADPQRTLEVTRLGVLGGYGGEQHLYELRLRVHPAEQEGQPQGDGKAPGPDRAGEQGAQGGPHHHDHGPAAR
jgi:hypothetical protein